MPIMSKLKFYRTCYVIIHGLFTIFELIYSYVIYIHDICIHLCQEIYPGIFKNKSFQYNLSTMKKPEHLTVLLGPDQIFPKELTNIVLWCLATQISFISFYDYKGVLKGIERDFQDEVLRKKNKEDHVIWHNDQHVLPKNGFSGRKVYVKVITEDSGKNSVVNLTKTLVNMQDRDFNIETVSKCLRKKFVFPDPDMGLICSNILCFYNYPPWEIRTTEFFQIGNIYEITFSNFLEHLWKFSMREQRLGK